MNHCDSLKRSESWLYIRELWAALQTSYNTLDGRRVS